MSNTPKIDEQLTEEAVGLERILLSMGLDLHARAVRVAYASAQQDIIQEIKYGKENIDKIIKTATSIAQDIVDQLEHETTNEDIIDLLSNYVDDFETFNDTENAPKFIQAMSTHVMNTLSEVIEYLKGRDYEEKIDDHTRELLTKVVTG